MKEINMHETTTWRITLGIDSGYNHRNSAKENIDEVESTLKGKVMDYINNVLQLNNNQVLSCVISIQDVLYPSEFGCPKDGEIVFVLDFTQNPHFVKNEAERLMFENEVKLLAKHLQTVYKQQTVSIMEIPVNNYIYLKLDESADESKQENESEFMIKLKETTEKVKELNDMLDNSSIEALSMRFNKRTLPYLKMSRYYIMIGDVTPEFIKQSAINTVKYFAFESGIYHRYSSKVTALKYHINDLKQIDESEILSKDDLTYNTLELVANSEFVYTVDKDNNPYKFIVANQKIYDKTDGTDFYDKLNRYYNECKAQGKELHITYALLSLK